MLNKLAIALAAVGIIALAVVFFTGGEEPRLEGEITSVRTLAIEEDATVVLVNFNVENVTRHPFVAHQRDLKYVDAEGDLHASSLVNAFALKQLFEYYPEIGGMKDEPFVAQTRIPAGETSRGLVAARFETPEEQVKNRRGVVLRLTDGVNRTTEIREAPEEE